MEGPTEQFNQTMVVQAPVGVSEADVVVVVQGLLDRHAMLRCRPRMTARAGGRCRCPRSGRWMRGHVCTLWR